jgi:hypothetical protein
MNKLLDALTRLIDRSDAPDLVGLAFGFALATTLFALTFWAAFSQ